PTYSISLHDALPIYSDSNKRYYTWDYYLRQKYGGKVFKVGLDAGFSCPNIDGARGRGGCTYCSYAFRRQSPEDLLLQYRQVQERSEEHTSELQSRFD